MDLHWRNVPGYLVRDAEGKLVSGYTPIPSDQEIQREIANSGFASDVIRYLIGVVVNNGIPAESCLGVIHPYNPRAAILQLLDGRRRLAMIRDNTDPESLPGYDASRIAVIPVPDSNKKLLIRVGIPSDLVRANAWIEAGSDSMAERSGLDGEYLQSLRIVLKGLLLGHTLQDERIFLRSRGLPWPSDTQSGKIFSREVALDKLQVIRSTLAEKREYQLAAENVLGRYLVYLVTQGVEKIWHYDVFVADEIEGVNYPNLSPHQLANPLAEKSDAIRWIQFASETITRAPLTYPRWFNRWLCVGYQIPVAPLASWWYMEVDPQLEELAKLYSPEDKVSNDYVYQRATELANSLMSVLRRQKQLPKLEDIGDEPEMKDVPRNRAALTREQAIQYLDAAVTDLHDGTLTEPNMEEAMRMRYKAQFLSNFKRQLVAGDVDDDALFRVPALIETHASAGLLDRVKRKLGMDLDPKNRAQLEHQDITKKQIKDVEGKIERAKNTLKGLSDTITSINDRRTRGLPVDEAAFKVAIDGRGRLEQELAVLNNDLKNLKTKS
jgi:hypothetical protein